MGLFLRVRGRVRRTRSFRFDDTTLRVVFGRDEARCQVVFARRLKRVGLEHCALERVLGEYRWVLNDTDPVYVDGLRVMEGDVLPPHGVLRLGHRGPRLFFSCGESAEVPTLQPLGRLRVGATRLRGLADSMRWNRMALITLALVLLGATAGGAMALHRRGEVQSLDGDARLRAALTKAAPSVYRTILRSMDGAEHGGGTAWVVAPGLLATNAHVAEHYESLPPGTRFLVRSSGARPKTFEVRGVRLHPGYDAFRLGWQHYGPTYSSDRHPRSVHSPGTACDVALLEVDAAADLGRPLRLASDARLHALRAGEPVGYVGYLSEGLALDGSPVRRPVAHVQTGALTAVTTFLGERQSPSDNTLLQHSCPGTGGSSGSPLLDTRGDVVGVIHAGNHAAGWRGRIPLGVGVDFAQRVDLLREFLDDEADAALVTRRARWLERMKVLYVSGGEIERETMREKVLTPWPRLPTAAVPGEHRVFAPVQIERLDVPRRSASAGRVGRDIALPREGQYAVLVWGLGGEPSKQVALTVRDEHGAALAEPTPVPNPGGPDAFQIVVHGAAILHAEAEPDASAAWYDVEVLRAGSAPDRPLAQATAQVTVLEAWQAHFARLLRRSVHLEVVYETGVAGGRVERMGWSEFVDVADAGLYLFVVRAKPGHGVEIVSPGDDEEGLPVTEQHAGIDARACYVAVPSRLFLWARVVWPGAAPGKVTARLYRVRFR